MANRNTVGFGLIAQGNVGSTDAAGKVKANTSSMPTTALHLFQGSAVQSKAGYIADAASCTYDIG